MNSSDTALLEKVVPEKFNKADAYNIRKNGKCVDRKISQYINIEPKEDGTGIDIYVKDDTLFGIINIPVIITESGLKDTVYNDFHIGKNSNVTIISGCAIHNDSCDNSEHNGIHRFFLEENSKVRYIEKHNGEGFGTADKILNPTTEITMKKNSYMLIDSTQLKGVDNTLRKTKATLYNNATLVINEKILTTNNQYAKTEFLVDLLEASSSVHVTSRSVAEDNSYQEFISNLIGHSLCYGHVECDAIIKDNGQVKSIPEIFAKNIDANLIHEASIGKIAGDQFIKLMTLGLTAKEAEEKIINGFLK